MASGCIIGECRLCHNLMWEDEEISFENSDITHLCCKNQISFIPNQNTI